MKKPIYTIAFLMALASIHPSLALAQPPAEEHANTMAADHPVSKEEFLQRHQQRAEKTFQRMDTNGDGTIDQQERRTAREKIREHRQHKPQ